MGYGLNINTNHFYLSCTGVLGAKQVNFGNQVSDWSNLQTLPLPLNISFLKRWCRWPTSLDHSFCWKFCRSTITLVIDIQYEFVYVTTVLCACSMSSSLCYCPLGQAFGATYTPCMLTTAFFFCGSVWQHTFLHARQCQKVFLLIKKVKVHCPSPMDKATY